MHQRWRIFSVAMALGLVLAACGPGQSAAPSATEGGESEPPASQAAFEPMSYPEDGPAECGAENNPSNISEIRAEDERTVVFVLCSPDVAFLPKIAFSSFAIDDSAYLEAHAADGSIVDQPNGTGPYRLEAWNRGSDIVLSAFENYWGDPALSPTVIFRWSTEPAQRLVELQAGTADGIDNPGADDFETIANDPNLALYEREGLNTLYFGFNNNPQVEGFDNSQNPFANQLVRQALAIGIDRQRIVDNFFPPGSVVATHFTPCAIPFGCEGEPWPDYDPEAAREMLAEAGYPNGFSTQIHLRDVARSYLPAPVPVATDLQAQLAELGITAEIDVQESTAFIDNADAGALTGIHILGWGADYPDPTNFLDYHFGAGASAQFGDKFPEITEPLQRGATTVDEAERAAAYEEANNAIRELVPMIPIAHGGSATAFQANIEGAHASPLSNENFSVMTPGDDDQLVWIQNGEPGGLYCADESDGEALRVCEQIKESLYAYEVGGTEAIPALAEECVPNDDLTEWTCTLREGVEFHDGSTLDANDVVLSYAVQWDAAHPLHVGRDGSFTYFAALWGGFLNPPAE
ncbi:MAG TPA: ABC transporter substrate-binding protein [candidate division Zixibacteria bacterium]|nr:ABC transporter substrate-binding protein [candidate division Zixibacteria bacterium]